MHFKSTVTNCDSSPPYPNQVLFSLQRDRPIHNTQSSSSQNRDMRLSDFDMMTTVSCLALSRTQTSASSDSKAGPTCCHNSPTEQSGSVHHPSGVREEGNQFQYKMGNSRVQTHRFTLQYEHGERAWVSSPKESRANCNPTPRSKHTPHFILLQTQPKTRNDGNKRR
jgi:hypothetical protein